LAIASLLLLSSFCSLLSAVFSIPCSCAAFFPKERSANAQLSGASGSQAAASAAKTPRFRPAIFSRRGRRLNIAGRPKGERGGVTSGV
jgi:hypothetical protein